MIPLPATTLEITCAGFVSPPSILCCTVRSLARNERYPFPAYNDRTRTVLVYGNVRNLKLTRTDTKSEHNSLLEHESFSSSLSCVVIAHILASNYPKPNAFGANVTVHSKLNLPVWKHHLPDHSDRNSIIFL